MLQIYELPIQVTLQINHCNRQIIMKKSILSIAVFEVVIIQYDNYHIIPNQFINIRFNLSFNRSEWQIIIIIWIPILSCSLTFSSKHRLRTLRFPNQISSGRIYILQINRAIMKRLILSQYENQCFVYIFLLSYWKAVTIKHNQKPI